ncbi:MAG: DNA polymerase III subunit alpha, partial [Nitrospirota bacterium]
DHGNMFGAVEFYLKAVKAGIKPIIGCEMYVSKGSRFERNSGGASEAAYHLVLLARNLDGYRNLMRLVSIGYIEGFYYKPRIDKDSLAQYSGGLIGLSACLKGEVASKLMAGDMEAARNAALEYRRILGPENFYLELQDNGLEEQRKVNELMLELSNETGIPLVATSDCHYFKREEARAHEALLCIQTGKTMSDTTRMRFQTDEFYFKPAEEMESAFEFHPEAISNTVKIAERCNLKLAFDEYHLPHYDVPEGYTKESYLEELARKGLERRLIDVKDNNKAYHDRLESELEIIKSMGFAGYFLVVWDFISYAKGRGIPVGPGRGSAVGSLVAYALEITDIDPLPYGLLFERFLNPERISMPDIDIDFCMDRRDEVITYVREKYGPDHVSQIITFGTMLARGAIRDVGRVLDVPYGDVDRVAKLVPETLKITLDEAVEQEPKLRELIKTDARVKEIFDTAKVLEGLTRHASKHAAGVVISQEPLTDYTPLYRDAGGEIVTQYAKDEIEKIGLVKFDFLGLRTLTVIDNAVKLINKGLPEEERFSLGSLKLDEPDEETYRLLSSGDAGGIFQLESSGMRDLLIRIKPDKFEDLIAIIALYRPGPMQSGMLDDYIKGRRGLKKIAYDPPQLEEILKDTYGVIVYQEQVMQIAVRLAGFTMGQADTLRKAMGKKKLDVMVKMKESFVKGASARGIPVKKADAVFELMQKFAEYGFNKSHSTAYALITYQTAYLKTHYKVQFMAALLSSEMDNTDKIVKYISDCRALGIPVLPPDVNRSEANFTAASDSILFGLAAVKNVGFSAIESIIEVRESGGPFKSLFDFCKRVDLRKVNRRVIEGLIRCGAFDSTSVPRARMTAVLDTAMDGGNQLARERQAGQSSIFDLMCDAGGKDAHEEYPDIPEWHEGELLAYEKETIGFYITGHPLARFEKDVKRYASNSTEELAELPDGREVTIIGVVRSRKSSVTRRGDKMAYLVMEDLQGTVEVIVFPELYKTTEKYLESDVPLLISGTLDRGEKGVKIKATKLASLTEVREKMTSRVDIKLSATGATPEDLLRLREVMLRYRGGCPVYLKINMPRHGNSLLSVKTGKDLSVTPTEGLINEVEHLLGAGAVSLG